MMECRSAIRSLLLPHQAFADVWHPTTWSVLTWPSFESEPKDVLTTVVHNKLVTLEQPSTGVLLVPVSSVRENRPYGIKCMVMVPVRGLGKKSGRIVNVRTIWELLDSDTPPRLANAYLRP
jgi:hypothetical protein